MRIEERRFTDGHVEAIVRDDDGKHLASVEVWPVADSGPNMGKHPVRFTRRVEHDLQEAHSTYAVTP